MWMLSLVEPVSLCFGIGVAVLSFLFANRWHLKTSIALSCVAGIGIWFFVWSTMPAIAWGLNGFWFFSLCALVLVTAISFLTYGDFVVRSGTALLITCGFFGIWMLSAFVSTWGAFHEDTYRNAVVMNTRVNFDVALEHIDTSTGIRQVDGDMAKRIAETELGKMGDIISQVQIGTMNLTQVGSDMFWQAPLEWNGFWKWKNSKHGTPGYIRVAKDDPRNVQLMNKWPIVYQIEGGFFQHNLKRHLYMNGYFNIPLSDYSFETDDNDRPYWVITRFKRIQGFSGCVPTGVVVVDAETGEIKDYTIENAPVWIDRIQPEICVIDQLNTWGEYPHGYWNWSDYEKVAVTEGSDGKSAMMIVRGSDGRLKWYSGIRSVQSDQGTVAVVLVDLISGEKDYYELNGITETSCQESIKGLIPEKTNAGWNVTPCILYGIQGEPTYISIIKDHRDNPKGFGVQSLVFRDAVAWGNSIEEALRKYHARLRQNGSVTADGGVDSHSIEDDIAKIGSEVIDGRTIYYLVLFNHPNRIFVFSSGVNPELALTNAGDRVKISYVDAGKRIIDALEFDNLRW